MFCRSFDQWTRWTFQHCREIQFFKFIVSAEPILYESFLSGISCSPFKLNIEFFVKVFFSTLKISVAQFLSEIKLLTNIRIIHEKVPTKM